MLHFHLRLHGVFLFIFYLWLNRDLLWYLLCFIFLLCLDAVRKTYIFDLRKQCVGFRFFSLSEGLCVTKDSKQKLLGTELPDQTRQGCFNLDLVLTVF